MKPSLIPPQKRGLFDLQGEDVRKFLNGIVTQDIQTLKTGNSCYALLCNNKGKILADLFVYCAGDKHFFVDCDLALRQKVWDQLKRYIIFQKIELQDLSDQWRGATVMNGGRAVPTSVRTIRKTVWGFPAMELWIPSGISVPFDLPVLGEAEQEILRIESATPKYGVDFDETNLPQEVGLLQAVSFTKGCYVGQEIIARLQHLGHVNKQLVLATSPEEPLDKVTSRCNSPKYQAEIRLGYEKRRPR